MPDFVALGIEELLESLRSQTAPTSQPNVDTTCFSNRIDLKRAVTKEDHVVQAMNLVRRTVGKPLECPYYDVVDDTFVFESLLLHVRVTPGGAYYVSTHEDANTKLHDGFIPPDANAPATISAIMCDHWADWMRQADEILKQQQ